MDRRDIRPIDSTSRIHQDDTIRLTWFYPLVLPLEVGRFEAAFGEK